MCLIIYYIIENLIFIQLLLYTGLKAKSTWHCRYFCLVFIQRKLSRLTGIFSEKNTRIPKHYTFSKSLCILAFLHAVTVNLNSALEYRQYSTSLYIYIYRYKYIINIYVGTQSRHTFFDENYYFFFRELTRFIYFWRNILVC